MVLIVRYVKVVRFGHLVTESLLFVELGSAAKKRFDCGVLSLFLGHLLELRCFVVFQLLLKLLLVFAATAHVYGATLFHFV